MPHPEPTRTGRLLGAVAMVAGPLALLGPAATAVRAQTAPAPLMIDDQRFAVTIGAPWTASFALASPQPPVVTVTVHDAVTGVAALDDAAASGGGSVVDTVDVNTTAGDDGTWSLEVATAVGPANADATLSVPAPGVYPVSLAATPTGKTITTATTFVTIVDPDVTPRSLRVALLTGVTDPGPWADDDDVAAARQAILDAAALADAVDAPLSLRLPPALVGPVATAEPSVVATGAPSVPETAAAEPTSPPTTATAPTEATDTVELATAFAGDELLSQTAFPLDPSALVAVDETALFIEQLVAGESAASAGLPLASRSRTSWVVDTAVSAPAARMLRTLGFQLVVTAATADEVAPGPARVALEGAQLVAVEISSLGAHLGPPRDGAAIEVAAHLAASVELVRAAGDRSTLVLARDDLALPDPTVTAAFARFVGETPGLVVTGLSDLAGPAAIAASGADVTLPATTGADLAARVDAIDAVEPRADQAMSMLVDPAPAEVWRAGFVGLLAATVDDEEAATQLGAITEDIDAVLSAVSASGPSQLTLTGTTSELPITLTNTSDRPLLVIVRVRSPKLTSPEQPPYTVLPGQDQVVKIPVRARSNGTFTLEVDVLSPDHQRVTDPLVMKATVRRVAGLSQVVTAGAVLVLATWWFSHLRRNRKARLATADAASPTSGTELSPDAAEARTEPVDRTT